MQIYIDESGNLGSKEKFFVLVALVSSDTVRIKNIIKKARRYYGKKDVSLEEIKAYSLNYLQKKDILTRLNQKDDFFCSCVVVNKKRLSPKLFAEKNLYYNHFIRYLLKPILSKSDINVQIILDKRTIKRESYNSLKDFIKIEAYTRWKFKKDIKLEQHDSKRYICLQAADLIANVVYRRYQNKEEVLFNLIKNKIRYFIKDTPGLIFKI
jgi:hypothetical protein